MLDGIAQAATRSYRRRVTTEYRTRSAPCAHCGDTVLIAQTAPLKLLGFRFGKEVESHLEHADPSPGGEVFDGVDDACTRTRVR